MDFIIPVAEIALGIEFAALVVKAMRQFMANHHSDASEIHGVISLLVEERRLQNSRRKNNFIMR